MPVLVMLFGIGLPILDALFALLVFFAVGRRIPAARPLSIAVAGSAFVCTCCLPIASRTVASVRDDDSGGLIIQSGSLIWLVGIGVHYLLVGCLLTVLLNTMATKATTAQPPPPPPTPREPPNPQQPTDFSDLPRYPG
jgi:hypothetical protein